MIARRVVAAVTLIALSAGFAFVLVEGLSSTVVTVRSLLAGRGRQAGLYSRYDPELGWASKPNLDLPDMFGAGVYLRTESHGFRGNVERAAAVPVGKIRTICSGDSFTFGLGVDDDHTWCEILSRLDDRLETINLGQGGYGLDQAFLRYRRDGVAMNATIHLFAFIDTDFERMRTNWFYEYGKPTLAIRDGALRVENVPAPVRPFYVPTTRVVGIVKQLKTYELIEKLRRRWGPRHATIAVGQNDAPKPAPAEVAELALRVFSELRDTATARNAVLVLVHLPVADDCLGRRGATTDVDWWTALAPRVRDLGIEVADLTDDCQRLTAREVDALFFREGESAYYSAVGHYTNEGNRFVAEALYRRLRAVIDRVN